MAHETHSDGCNGVEAVRQAGRAAFSRRTDAFVLDVLTDDSAVDPSTGVRTRVLRYGRDGHEAGRRAGLPTSGPLQLRLTIGPSAAGAAVEVLHNGTAVQGQMDSSGCVAVSGIEPGPVSLVVDVPGSDPQRIQTSWVNLRRST